MNVSKQAAVDAELEALFGPVIYAYTRAQAIEDGVLIDVSEAAKGMGITWPVALTSAVFEDCVCWTDDDSARKPIGENESDRLSDLLVGVGLAILVAARRRDESGPMREVKSSYSRVPRDGVATAPSLVPLKMVIGPGDSNEPVITIMLPHED